MNRVMTEQEMKETLINLGGHYANLLIRVHDLRRAAEGASATLKQTREAIKKGEGGWPYVDRAVAHAIHTLDTQIEKVKEAEAVKA